MLRNPARAARSSIEMSEPARGAGAGAEPDAAPLCVRWDDANLPGAQRARRTAVTPSGAVSSWPIASHRSLAGFTTARKDGLMSGVSGRRRARHARAKLTIGRSSTTVRLACVIIALGPSVIAAADAPEAQAASYAVWACANGSGAPLSVGSWVRAVDAGLAEAQATCAEPSAGVGAFRAAARATLRRTRWRRRVGRRGDAGNAYPITTRRSVGASCRSKSARSDRNGPSPRSFRRCPKITTGGRPSASGSAL